MLTITETNHGSAHFVALNEEDITRDNIRWSHVIYNIDGTLPWYNMISIDDAPRYATDFSYFRYSQYLHLAKVIVLGEFCASDATQPMVDSWGEAYTIQLFTMALVGDTATLPAPTYTSCNEAVNSLDFEFYQVDDAGNVASDRLDWVAYNYAS